MLSFFEPRLRFFSKWWVQLFAESEGKDGKGLFPTVSEYTEDLHSVGQFIQEGSPILFETFLSVNNPGVDFIIKPSVLRDGFEYLDNMNYSNLNKAAETATMEAHSKRFPCVNIVIPTIDEYSFGELIFFFEFSCYLSSIKLEVNPFNQPGVEEYKRAMFKLLGK